jgi:hypothetical protein
MPDLDDHGARPLSAAAGQVPDRAGKLAPSRRSVLRGAAAAGTAGMAVTTLGTAIGGAAAKASTTHEVATSPDGPRDAAGSEPVVLHIRDAATGEIEVFRGTTQTRLYDRELAAQILRASR